MVKMMGVLMRGLNDRSFPSHLPFFVEFSRTRRTIDVPLMVGCNRKRKRKRRILYLSLAYLLMTITRRMVMMMTMTRMICGRSNGNSEQESEGLHRHFLFFILSLFSPLFLHIFDLGRIETGEKGGETTKKKNGQQQHRLSATVVSRVTVICVNEYRCAKRVR